MNTLFEGGLLGLGFTLAARYLAFPGRYLTNGPFAPPNKRTVVFFHTITGQMVSAADPVPDPFGPFPYGAAVEGP